MSRNMHKWEELRPEEFLSELKRAPVVYWACGPMEDHGLQNALGVDPCKAYEMCLRAAALTGGVVFPLVPFAPAGAPPLSREQRRSGRHTLFPPSLFVSVELCRQIYLEVLENMAELGFRVCVAFGGHGPAAGLLKNIVKELRGKLKGMAILPCGSATFIGDLLRPADGADPGVHAGRHGGRWETSMNMALNPEFVDLSRVRQIEPSPIPSQLKGLDEANIGDIEKSSVEFGEKLMSTSAQRLANEVRRILGQDAPR